MIVPVRDNALTMLRDNWEALRSQWEYAHAVRAILYVLAFGTLVISVLDLAMRQGQESLMRIYLDWNLPPPSLVGSRWNPRSVGRER